MGTNNNGQILLKLAEYITKMAYGRWRNYVDRDEIKSEAYVAAIIAAKRWPAEIDSVEWTKRLGWASYNLLIDGLRKQNLIPKHKDKRFHLQLTNSEADLQASDESFSMIDTKDEIEWLTEGIPSDTYQAILLHKGRGITLAKVAKQLGTSKYHVREMVNTATSIMRLKAKRRK